VRILDLCEFYSERGGGVRSYLDKLTKAASLHDHEVVVVAPGPRDEETHDGNSRLIRYAAPPMPYDPTYHVPWRLDRMRSIVQRQQPDVMQVSSPFIPALVAATLKQVPVRAYFYHSDPIGCYVRPTSRRLLPPWGARAVESAAWAWMRRVCTASDFTVVAGTWLQHLLENKGCGRVETVPFGITHSDFGPRCRDDALRREMMGPLADDPAAKLLLITGRLAVDKRQALLVQAIVKLAQERPLALVVLGDGPSKDTIRATAAPLAKATFLSFTRDRAQYAAMLASVDALVHGSLCETFGFVIAETLASGTPVLVPNAGGAPQLVDGDCAEVYPADASCNEIAAHLARLLDRSRAPLSSAAQRAAAVHPTMDEHFESLFALYERELARPRSS